MGFKWNFLSAFFTDYGYWAVLFVLIICGFGVPIPEDITLVSGGVIAGLYPESVKFPFNVVSQYDLVCLLVTLVCIGLVAFTAPEFFVSAQCAKCSPYNA